MIDRQTGAIRMLWMLYSDTRSRINTLLAEFKQVQLTAYAHMKHAAPDVLLYPPQFRNVTGYAQFGIREKQYLAVADNAATEIERLCNFRDGLSSAFRHANTELAGQESGPGTSVYWFMAKRAHVIDCVLEDSTNLLSYLHDKVAQMLDTTSGSMPHPLALRRWQSAGHEKFLSAYCRDLSLDMAKLMAFLNVRHFDPDQGSCDGRDLFEKRSSRRWKDIEVSHIWHHGPTSETKSQRAPHASGSPHPISFALIRSMYYYIEHPALFPLLFHEIAHIHMRLDENELDSPSSLGHDSRDSFFFLVGARKTAEHLKVAVIQEGMSGLADADFYQLASEVWADAVGVALGGSAFVHALALQILGQAESENILKGQSPTSSDHSLDNWAIDIRKLDEDFALDKPIPYFAIARVLVAARLARQFYGLAQLEPRTETDLPFKDELHSSCDAIEDLWHFIKESGDIVFGKDRTSGEHAQWWVFYCKLNEWVATVCSKHLEPHVARMWQYLKDHRRHAHRLSCDGPDALVRERVWEFFRAFVGTELPNGLGFADANIEEVLKNLKDKAPARLEDAPLSVRWAIGSLLYDGSVNARLPAYPQLDRLIDSTRWDGLATFRYVLEWYQLIVSKGHSLASDIAAGGPGEGRSWPLKMQLLASDLHDLFVKHEAADLVTLEWLLHKFTVFFMNPRYKPWDNQQQKSDGQPLVRLKWIAQNRDAFEKASAGFIAALKTDLFRSFDKVNASSGGPFGMLCLGVLRPSLASGFSHEKQTGYQSFEAIGKFSQSSLGDGGRQGVFPVLGDYNYIRWLPGRTITNLIDLSDTCIRPTVRHKLSTHRSETIPRHLEKPRMLLRVFGRDPCELLSSGLDCGRRDDHFLRLALLKFNHRASWTELLDLLEQDDNKQRALETCGLYLSSGWEDVVLIVRHSNPQELTGNTTNDLLAAIKGKLDVRPEELDVQSMLITVPPSQEESGQYFSPAKAAQRSNGGAKNLDELCRELQLSAAQYLKLGSPNEQWTRETTLGRYDALLKWPGLSPKDLQGVFLSLNPAYLHQMQHIVHGLSWDQSDPTMLYLFSRVDLTIH